MESLFAAHGSKRDTTVNSFSDSLFTGFNIECHARRVFKHATSRLPDYESARTIVKMQHHRREKRRGEGGGAVLLHEPHLG